MVGRGFRKWVRFQDGRYLSRRPHNDIDWLPNMGKQARFKVRLHFRRRSLAVKDNIAAGDVGPNAKEPGVRAHGLEIGHREFAGAPNIHRTQ